MHVRANDVFAELFRHLDDHGARGSRLRHDVVVTLVRSCTTQRLIEHAAFDATPKPRFDRFAQAFLSVLAVDALGRDSNGWANSRLESFLFLPHEGSKFHFKRDRFAHGAPRYHPPTVKE